MVLWSKVAERGAEVVRSVVQRIDPQVACTVDSSRGFRNDTIDVRLHRQDNGRTKAVAVVTYEAWTQAESDPTDLENHFRVVIGSMTEHPREVFQITTKGLRREPLEDIKVLDNPAAWERFEIGSTGMEADRVVDLFRERREGR